MDQISHIESAVSSVTGQRVPRAGLKLSLVYWLTLLVVLTALAVLDGWETWVTFSVRCTMTVFAVTMTWLVSWVVTSDRSSRFSTKAILVSAVTVGAATGHYYVSYYLFRMGDMNDSPMTLAETLRGILFWVGTYLGWSALFLAQHYSTQVIERERQLLELRELAYGAQMRALRYQINPHFLFNTLNAIATLIEERELPNAERMVLSLSAFLRSTLALDPMQDIALAEELDIQRRYLDIERERFSDRLTVALDIPPELHRALVPSLILQPLVENAVKHGVGAVERCVRIRIGADADAETLNVHVENDASEAPLVTSGTGTGLTNIAQRLAARFGAAGGLGPALSPRVRFARPCRSRFASGRHDPRAHRRRRAACAAEVAARPVQDRPGLRGRRGRQYPRGGRGDCQHVPNLLLLDIQMPQWQRLRLAGGAGKPRTGCDLRDGVRSICGLRVSKREPSIMC